MQLDSTQLGHASYMINDFIVTHLRRLNQRFDGDLHLALILGEIAHYNVKRVLIAGDGGLVGPDIMRDRDAMRASYRGCNALSISSATGIPRETTRRKIRALAARGWIRKDRHHGWIVTPLAGEDLMDFTHMTLDEFTQLSQRMKPFL